MAGKQEVQVTSPDAEAIRNLRQAITDGKHWYHALLEIIRVGRAIEETCNVITYQHILGTYTAD